MMKIALVVGIDKYPKGSELRGCVNDATAITTLLESHADGSPNFDVRTLFDIQTKGELQDQIEELFSRPADTALFYFSGHGLIDNFGGGYLVTPDVKKKDWGVDMNKILQIANASKIKNKIIILDCCHSGALGEPEPSTVINLNEGVSILTASGKDEPSMEVGGHGVFTTLLMEALKGGAADLRGHITPGSIYSFIDQALGLWDQRPVFKTNINKFTSIREVNPSIPASVLREIIKLFPVPQNSFDLDPSFEFTNDPSIVHEYIQPFADEEKVSIFKKLQLMNRVGLVVPVDEEHMYFAAMNSKSCRLTALGMHYWKLVNNKRI